MHYLFDILECLLVGYNVHVAIVKADFVKHLATHTVAGDNMTPKVTGTEAFANASANMLILGLALARGRRRQRRRNVLCIHVHSEKKMIRAEGVISVGTHRQAYTAIMAHVQHTLAGFRFALLSVVEEVGAIREDVLDQKMTSI
jgi:hypothetical protein